MKDVILSINESIATLYWLRIAATLIIIIWTARTVYCVETSDEVERCTARHRALFGDNSVLYMVFQMWYVVILLAVASNVGFTILPHVLEQ